MTTNLLESLSPEQQYKTLYEIMYNLCKSNNWGDPFSYSHSRAIYMAIELNHTIAETYSGEDAYIIENDSKVKFEYKSTMAKNINGKYNGISVKDTLVDQINYIVSEKIGCYKTHYYSRFSGGKIEEIWAIPGEIVLEILLPKIAKQFVKMKSSVKQTADPRIGFSITSKEIKKYGIKVY